MIRCVLVDDEELALLNTRAMLEPATDIDIVASFTDPDAALASLIAEPPDLVFLDIKMPGLSGMALLERLVQELPPERRPYAVLVTAFDRYALQAFEYDALDYLVKPVGEARFAASLDRARERIRLRRESTQAADSATPVENHTISIKVSGGMARVSPDEIVWVEAEDHYVMLHTRRRSHLVRGTISAFERELAPLGFVRVHRGALAHPRHVSSSETLRDGSRELTLVDGSRIRASRRRWPDIAPLLFPDSP